MMAIEPEDRISGAQVLKALGATTLMAVAAGLITAYALRGVAPSWGGGDRLAAVIVGEVYVAIIVGHLIAFHGWRGTREFLRLQPVSADQILAACAVWAAGWMAAAVIYLALSPWLWPLTYIRDAFMWIGADGGRLASMEPLLFVLGAGRAVTVTPIAEEMLFRGSLFGWIRARVTAPVTIVVTASLFALAHPMAVLWPGAFCFGLGAAWYRERSHSLTPFVIVHMLNSVALVAASYVFTGWNVPKML
jgi:membrane protease YdiL (CAAX protease family)